MVSDAPDPAQLRLGQWVILLFAASIIETLLCLPWLFSHVSDYTPQTYMVVSVEKHTYPNGYEKQWDVGVQVSPTFAPEVTVKDRAPVIGESITVYQDSLGNLYGEKPLEESPSRLLLLLPAMGVLAFAYAWRPRRKREPQGLSDSGSAGKPRWRLMVDVGPARLSAPSEKIAAPPEMVSTAIDPDPAAAPKTPTVISSVPPGWFDAEKPSRRRVLFVLLAAVTAGLAIGYWLTPPGNTPSREGIVTWAREMVVNRGGNSHDTEYEALVEMADTHNVIMVTNYRSRPHVGDKVTLYQDSQGHWSPDSPGSQIIDWVMYLVGGVFGVWIYLDRRRARSREGT